MLLDNYRMWQIAKNIYFCENGSYLTTRELANQVGIEYTNPYYYKVLKELKEMKAITIFQTIGNVNIIKIDHNILKKALENSKIFDEFVEFVENKTGGLYKV